MIRTVGRPGALDEVTVPAFSVSDVESASVVDPAVTLARRCPVAGDAARRGRTGDGACPTGAVDKEISVPGARRGRPGIEASDAAGSRSTVHGLAEVIMTVLVEPAASPAETSIIVDVLASFDSTKPLK